MTELRVPFDYRPDGGSASHEPSVRPLQPRSSARACCWGPFNRALVHDAAERCARRMSVLGAKESRSVTVLQSIPLAFPPESAGEPLITDGRASRQQRCHNPAFGPCTPFSAEEFAALMIALPEADDLFSSDLERVAGLAAGPLL